MDENDHTPIAANPATLRTGKAIEPLCHDGSVEPPSIQMAYTLASRD